MAYELTEAEQERFWNLVDVGDCWQWTGAVTHRGYSRFGFRRTAVSAYRLAWELLVGPIPDGLTIDHVCRNKLCVNPDHLEPVTHGENIRRAYGRAGLNLRKTHCPSGHPLSGSNLIINSRGRRVCRECRRVIDARWYAKVKANNALASQVGESE